MKSRIELYLNAIKTGEFNNLPDPTSRIEKLLYAIATGEENNIESPSSRVEEALYYILKNGGVGGGSSSDEWIIHHRQIKEILKLEGIEIKDLTLTDNIEVKVVEV